jgi:hypothetical protein
MSADFSFRKHKLESRAKELGIILTTKVKYPTTLSEIPAYKSSGQDPNTALHFLVANHFSNSSGREALRRLATGASAWLQLSWLLSMRV